MGPHRSLSANSGPQTTGSSSLISSLVPASPSLHLDFFPQQHLFILLLVHSHRMGATTSKATLTPAATASVMDEKRAVLDSMAMVADKADATEIGDSLTIDVLDKWGKEFEKVCRHA